MNDVGVPCQIEKHQNRKIGNKCATLLITSASLLDKCIPISSKKLPVTRASHAIRSKKLLVTRASLLVKSASLFAGRNY